MEKQKRWQLYVIVAVMAITLYSILPTLFYYTQPLKSPIDETQAKIIARKAVERVNSLEQSTRDWLFAFGKNLGVQIESVELDKDDPKFVYVTLENPDQALLFKRVLAKAGSLIPFAPAQLSLRLQEEDILLSNAVTVERNIGLHLDNANIDHLFTFSNKLDAEKNIAPFYKTLMFDRVAELAYQIAGPSRTALQVAAIVDHPNDARLDNLLLVQAEHLSDLATLLPPNHPYLTRTFASFTQINHREKNTLMTKWVARAEKLQQKITQQLTSTKGDEKALLEQQKANLDKGLNLVKSNLTTFQSGKTPLTREEITKKLEALPLDKSHPLQHLSLEGYNPFVASLTLNFSDDSIEIVLYPDKNEAINQPLFDEIARIAEMSDEKIKPYEEGYRIAFSDLTDSQSVLALNLEELAQVYIEKIKKDLTNNFKPTHKDLIAENYPIYTFEDYMQAGPTAKGLGLVLIAPNRESEAGTKGLNTSSLYVIAKGVSNILEKYKDIPTHPEAKLLESDFNQLQTLLHNQGFIGYSGASFGLDESFAKDYIFEFSQYYRPILMATREAFSVKGSDKWAILEFTDKSQRLIAENKIDDKIHEELVKWSDEYHAAQVGFNKELKYLIPAPTKNIYWDNFKLSAKKYFRGDDEKVLKWGLDLSGGKSVRIGLEDQAGRSVTNPQDLLQASNELYQRINKLGVSEQTIRIENETIAIDFPSSQALSAQELIKASTMNFNIVNEKFGLGNRELANNVNHFLQEVWNEAVVTHQKDNKSINKIAFRHLNSDRNTSANLLVKAGLKLADPEMVQPMGTFDDTLSKIAIFRGSESTEWHGQTHPLLIVFALSALEGSSLDNVQVGYDPSEGNMLTFSVKSKQNEYNPQNTFYQWTSHFSEESIASTPKASFTGGRGWRMAVILNGEVISAPSLKANLKDRATISGRFTQREVNNLAADLKAGSLSFTPKILSEQNVSPELGKEERAKGIFASCLAFSLVAFTMIGYYRFAGLVACVAVLFNLLLIWAALQSIGAALTLPGIAGIVLTIGMAVDANVLVFERIKEEFANSGKIASAIAEGYKKAFSAIFDSNITTLMAAFILIQFDSGPIKGFAMTLMIGIASSMFTSLFMTRYFFAGWVQNPKNTQLSMSHWMGNTRIDFLKYLKPALVISLILAVAGTLLIVSQRKSIIGMDFTGGYSLIVNVEEKKGEDLRLKAIEALAAKDNHINDFEVRELSRPNQLRIQLGRSMEEMSHPFYNLPQQFNEGNFKYEYQKNPRIQWVITALEANGLTLQQGQQENLHKNWTTMSGQFSDHMRNNAVLALIVALIGILIYITVRFEFKYAVAAVLGLIHDVIITLGVLALFHKMGFAVQIDLQVIGAVMTIIGYSLNDTIIVCDRIREEVRLLQGTSYKEIINISLNQTLSRTMLTSGTTLLVLLALVFFGGSTIFSFSLVMTIGVVMGTISSIFVAPYVLLKLHKKETRAELQAKS